MMTSRTGTAQTSRGLSLHNPESGNAASDENDMPRGQRTAKAQSNNPIEYFVSVL